jgi:hypothetical protein
MIFSISPVTFVSISVIRHNRNITFQLLAVPQALPSEGVTVFEQPFWELGVSELVVFITHSCQNNFWSFIVRLVSLFCGLGVSLHPTSWTTPFHLV